MNANNTTIATALLEINIPNKRYLLHNSNTSFTPTRDIRRGFFPFETSRPGPKAVKVEDTIVLYPPILPFLQCIHEYSYSNARTTDIGTNVITITTA